MELRPYQTDLVNDIRKAKHVGEKFNRLTVVEVIDSRRVKCICDCGKVIVTRLDSVLSGKSKSCGCLQREIVTKNSTRHGKSKHPLYKTWHNIRGRCKNPNATKYKYYGGKGIKICAEWDNDFISFYNWSINNGWAKGLSIDRIDSDKDYCPNNCRWVNYFVQNNNLKTNHIIEYKGEKHSVYEWAHILNMNVKTFSERIRRGWSIQRAIETPIVARQRQVRK